MSYNSIMKIMLQIHIKIMVIIFIESSNKKLNCAQLEIRSANAGSYYLL